MQPLDLLRLREHLERVREGLTGGVIRQLLSQSESPRVELRLDVVHDEVDGDLGRVLQGKMYSVQSISDSVTYH